MFHISKEHICYDCAKKPILSIIGIKKDGAKVAQDLYICQRDKCKNELNNLSNSIDKDWKKTIGTNLEDLNRVPSYFDQCVIDFVKKKAPTVFKELVAKLSPSILFIEKVNFRVGYPQLGLLPKMKKEFIEKGKIVLAENLIKCGRQLDAAKIYEQMRNYDKARALRENEKRIVIKKTNVSLNLNDLLKQIKNEGIVAIFRCPNCSGKLKIGKKTSLKSLRTCEYCGFEIESMELADFLTTALS